MARRTILHRKPCVLICSLPLFSGLAHAQGADFELFELITGEPTTLSATGAPVRESEAPADITIISQDEIRRSGARDLPELFRQVAGMSVWRTAAGSAEVSVRGYNQGYNRRILVLVDGRQVYADHFSFVTWSAIPVTLEEIRQIEIVKGPAAALFGFNAAAGVINITTYDPAAIATNAVTLRAATGGLYEAEGTIAYKADRVGVRLSARGGVENAFDVISRNEFQSFEEDPSRVTTSLRAAFNPTTEWNFDFEASYSATRQNDFSPIASPARSELDIWALKGGAAWSGAKAQVSLRAFHNEVEQDADLFPGLVDTAEVRNPLTVATAEVLLKYFLKHTFRITGEYRRSKVNQAPVNFGEVSYNVFSGAGMWDWRFNEKLRFTASGRMDHLELGLNGDLPDGFVLTENNFDESITEFSGNAAFVFQPTGRDTFRFLFGRGALLPSLLEFGGLNAPSVATVENGEIEFGPFGGNLIIFGDPDLDPTRVLNAEIAYVRTVDALGGGFSLKGFYNRTSNILLGPDLRFQRDANGELTSTPVGGTVLGQDPQIASLELQGLVQGLFDLQAAGALDPEQAALLQVLAPLPESQFFNAGSSRLFGLEAEWTGRVGENFTYGLAYTFLDVQDDLDTESEDVPAELADFFTGQVLANTNIFYERGTPAHTINLRAGYVCRKLTLDGSAVWTSSYEVPLLGETPGSRGQFVLIDIPSRWHVLATAAYAVTDALEARFTVEGLTDRRFPEAPIYEAERRIIGTLTYRF